MKKYTVLVTVEGAGPFPFDMLRHDSCQPACAAELEIIGEREFKAQMGAPRRRVQVAYEAESLRVARHPELVTVRRWQSFGWSVIDRSEPVSH